MIMLKSNNFLWIRLTIVSLLLTSCGVDSGPHFDKKKKKYGVNDANIQSNEAEASVNDDRGDDQVRIDGEGISSFQQDPNELIFRSRYQGTMNRETLSFLFLRPVVGGAVEEVRPEDSTFYRDLELPGVGVVRRGSGPAIERLAKTPIDLIAEQTAGDKHSATFRQHVSAPFGEDDSGLDVFADSSENGTQIYDRILGGSDCPESLVCINRAQTLPEAGGGQTFCYYDQEGQSTTIPIGIAPGASYEGVKDLPQQYGPYSVRRFAVEGVDCANTSLTPADDRQVIITLGLTKSTRVLEKVNGDNHTGEEIDFGVTVFVDMLNEHGRRKPHNTRPYIDTVTGFQSATSYYFNNDTGRLLKIIKTFRKEFTGAPVAIGYQGLVVDIGFRFCKSLLAENGQDFCAEGQQ